MRVVVARTLKEGLGNEMLPWAKGWIASQVLDAHLVGPSWGRNVRRYYRHFGTSRLDFLLERALMRLPHHAFTEQDYRATGEVDFGRAIERWGATRGVTRQGSFIVSVDGMYGGYPSIRGARQFLLAKLLNSRDALRNVYEVLSKLDRNKLFVAVSMRSVQKGGFRKLDPGESVRGKWNIQVPVEWYLGVCEALRQRFGEVLQFRIFTDCQDADSDELVRRFNPGQTRQQGLTDCSNLLLMAQADLLICAISSFSLATAFLSGNPYLWYEPQLTLTDGLYSLWGYETYQEKGGSLTRRSMEYVSSLVSAAAGQVSPVSYLGTAMNIGDPLPDGLVELLEQRLHTHDPRTNLIEYGCLPALPQN